METRNDLSLPRELLDAADSPSARDREAFVKNLRTLPPDAVLMPPGGVTFDEGRAAPASNVHVITTDGGEHLSVDQLRADAAGVARSLAREHGRTTAKLKTRAQSPARKRRLLNRLARLEGDAKRVQGYRAALDALEEGLSTKGQG